MLFPHAFADIAASITPIRAALDHAPNTPAVLSGVIEPTPVVVPELRVVDLVLFSFCSQIGAHVRLPCARTLFFPIN